MQPRIGIVKSFEDKTETSKSKREIRKIIATIDFINGESSNIEFKGDHRELFIKGFIRENDRVQVAYMQLAHRSRSGHYHNNAKGTSIKRI